MAPLGRTTRVVDFKSVVYILYTGGTLGMKPTVPGNLASPLEPASLDELRELVGELGNEAGIRCELGSLTEEDGSAVAPFDSSEVSPDHWLTIAAAIERVYQDFDGFVVIHGTDTLAYTASALSFLLVNLAKPVVLTGAQRPLCFERTDGRQNLISAVYVAGHKATGLPLVPEVTVCFGDALLRGNRTVKTSTTARDGFSSPNYPPLGDMGEPIQIYQDRIRSLPPAHAPFYVHRKLVREVMDVTLFPGVRADQLRALFSQPDLRGVVLRTFGSGNTPRDPHLLEVVANAAAEGKALMVITQCLEGRVDLGRYDASTRLLRERVVSGFDLTPAAALTKLMWMLALEQGEELALQLQISHRGEQSFNQFDLSWGPIGEPEPVPLADLSGRPHGLVEPKRLERAILRLHGLRAEGPLLVFINAAGLSAEARRYDVRRVAVIEEPGSSEVLDLTAGVRRLIVEGQPIRLTLTAEGRTFSAEQVDLSLLVEVP